MECFATGRAATESTTARGKIASKPRSTMNEFQCEVNPKFDSRQLVLSKQYTAYIALSLVANTLTINVKSYILRTYFPEE